ncbi:hypothetical protein P8452_57988 [Trifolium repens]|nr:hypothetical protein P8452_57988 [Trifolium repens]
MIQFSQCLSDDFVFPINFLSSEENESSLVGQLVRHEEPVRGLEFSTIAPNPTIKGKIVVKEGNNGCGSCHSQRNNLDLAKHLIIPSLNSF